MALYEWAVQTKAKSEAAAGLRFDLPEDCLRQALQLAPGNETVREVIGLCEAQLGEGR